MFGLGTTELIIVLLILLFLFGARRIPALAKSIGEGIRAFRTGAETSEGPAETGIVRREE